MDQNMYKTVIFSSNKKMNATQHKMASQTNLMKKNFVSLVTTGDQPTAADTNNRRNSVDATAEKPPYLSTESAAKSEVRSQTKMSPREMSKQERNEILSQYYSDKRKMQNTINA